MSKSFLLGDIHLGIHQMDLDKWLDIHKLYFNDFLLPILKNMYQENDKIFILGNLFNNKNFLNIKIISYTLELFDKFESLNYDIIILVGNNDYYNNEKEYTSLKILEKYKNVKIVIKPEVYNFCDKKILLLPWDEPNKQLEIMKKCIGRVDYLFTNCNLKGVKNNNSNGNTIADFIGFPKVYASNNNIYQKIDNFTYIGNSFHMDKNDKHNKKGLTVLDFTDNSEMFIENNITPEYKNIDILTEEDLNKLDIIYTDKNNNFFEIKINNSIFTKSLDIKRRIQEISLIKNITDIKYIDDINNEDVIENMAIDDIDSNITTEDLIRNYIKKQNVGDDLKNKYILILDDVIKIHKNNM